MRTRIATPADVPALTSLINDAYVVERFFQVGDRIDAARVGALQQRGSFLLLENDELVGSSPNCVRAVILVYWLLPCPPRAGSAAPDSLPKRGASKRRGRWTFVW